jgi:MYXO-CTERM domain-containing protein
MSRIQGLLVTLCAVACTPSPAEEVLDDLDEGALVDGTPPYFRSAAHVLFAGVNPVDVTQFGECPTTVADGATTIVDASCQGGSGIARFPTGLSFGTPTAGVVEYEDYVADTIVCDGAPSTRWGADGRVELREAGDGFDFSIDLLITTRDFDCGPTVRHAIVYDGHLSVDGEVGTISGRGRYGDDEAGVFAIETEDEVLDTNACESGALSGRTFMRARGREAIVEYDGATRCEPEALIGVAPWTLDGVAQGEDGLGCSASPGRHGSGWAAALALAAAALLRRRR